MLDKLKLSQDLARIAHHLFPDTSNAAENAEKVWRRIASDETFADRVAQSEATFLLPSWRGSLNDTALISTPESFSYTVVSVDGSQVYPDRHVAGAGCFLLNVGGVTLSYGPESSADFFNEPRICVAEELQAISSHATMSRDVVDALRERDELRYSYERAREVLEATGTAPTVLFDGTIIFWPLEGMVDDIRSFFISSYLSYLEKLYQDRIPCAGYISMPKSRELINLVKLGLCRFTVAGCIPCHGVYDSFPCSAVDMLIDTHLIARVIPQGHRTTLFASTSHIVSEYPEHLRPWFCYINTEHEVIRLEMPAWVAQDAEALSHVCSVALDQANKGMGYPVCLAESHEQAVVKGADREFFFHLLAKQGVESKRSLKHSQKSIKKRRLGV